MRKREKDPYFAIFLMLVPLLIVWLGLAGPLFEDAAANGVISTIRGWQTLIAAFIAIGAACVAWWNTTRQLRHAAELERTRRSRKQLPYADYPSHLATSPDTPVRLANLYELFSSRLPLVVQIRRKSPLPAKSFQGLAAVWRAPSV